MRLRRSERAGSKVKARGAWLVGVQQDTKAPAGFRKGSVYGLDPPYLANAGQQDQRSNEQNADRLSLSTRHTETLPICNNADLRFVE